MENKGCVYFFRHIGLSPVKIGYSSSDSPAIRFLQFKTYAPYGSEIIGFIITSDAKQIETNLHRKYSHKRLSGEWFEITVEDAQYEIDFYSNVEDVKSRNDFQIAWANSLLKKKERVSKETNIIIHDFDKKETFMRRFKEGEKINIKKYSIDNGVSRTTIHRWINKYKNNKL